MSLVIKLKEKGSKNQHTYRVVVMEKRSRRNGRSIAEIGYFNPLVKPPTLKIDKPNLEKWISKGAKLSKGVKKILK